MLFFKEADICTLLFVSRTPPRSGNSGNQLTIALFGYRTQGGDIHERYKREIYVYGDMYGDKHGEEIYTERGHIQIGGMYVQREDLRGERTNTERVNTQRGDLRGKETSVAAEAPLPSVSVVAFTARDVYNATQLLRTKRGHL